MPTSTSAAIDYSELSDSIQLFSKISQINTSFYDFDHTLLKGGNIYHDSSDIQHHLSPEDTATTLLFPVVANANIIGFVICDANHASQERVKLSKTYIESIANDTLGRSLNTHVEVLNPLNAQNMSQMHKFILLFKPALSKINQFITPKSPVKTTAGGASSIDNILTYVQNNIRTPLSLESVSQNVFLSPSYLSRIFKKNLHVNFIDYVNCQKVAIACKHLMLTNEKVSVISRQVGSSQNSYFSKVFKGITGMTPLEYRRNHHTVQKVHTIPRDLSWGIHDTVFDISRRYFKRKGISFTTTQNENGDPYVTQIGDLPNSDVRGWVYTLDCRQPNYSSTALSSEDNSVIQWIYTVRS